MSKKKQYILGTIAIALVLCCGAGTLTSILSPETTVMPTVAATAIPITDTAAQATRTAADADAWATKAAVPTATPTIAPSPTIVPTVAHPTAPTAELSYFTATMEVVMIYENASSALGVLSAEAGNDPTVILDDEWRLATAVNLGSILTAGEMLRKIDPPAKYSEAHTEFLAAATHYDNFVDLYSRGLDDVNVDLINAAVDELQLGTAAMARSTAILSEMQ